MKKRTNNITIMKRTTGLIFVPDEGEGGLDCLGKLVLKPYEEGGEGKMAFSLNNISRADILSNCFKITFLSNPPASPLPLRKPPGYREPGVPIHHAPPRKPVKLPPSFQQTKRRRRNCCRVFCCCICISTFILIIVFAGAGLLFYVCYQPRLPQIQLKSIDFTNFNVSTNSDGPVLDTQSTVGIVIRNRNQDFGIIYDRTTVSLNAVNGDVNLGERTVPGFAQGKSNVTTLRFAMKVQKEPLDGRSAEELKKGFKNKNLMMNAEIRSGIGLQQSRWTMNPVQVTVLCSGMRLNQVQGGGSTPTCRIKFLNWFYIN